MDIRGVVLERCRYFGQESLFRQRAIVAECNFISHGFNQPVKKTWMQSEYHKNRETARAGRRLCSPRSLVLEGLAYEFANIASAVSSVRYWAKKDAAHPATVSITA